MCFSITAASAEERGTIIFIEKRKKRQVDQERTGRQSREHHSAGKSIFL